MPILKRGWAARELTAREFSYGYMTVLARELLSSIIAPEPTYCTLKQCMNLWAPRRPWKDWRYIQESPQLVIGHEKAPGNDADEAEIVELSQWIRMQRDARVWR